MKKILFLLSILAFLFASPAFAGTAANCSSEAIQTAIDNAVDGEIVDIPACSETSWNSSVTIPSTKGITLRGAGTVDANGNYSSGGTRINLGGSKYLMVLTDPANSPVRITGIYFSHSHIDSAYGAIMMEGWTTGYRTGSTNWRIDHNYFNYTGSDETNSGPGVIVRGWTYGVIDNCVFYHQGRATFVEMGNDDWELTGYYGDGSWDTDIGGPIDWGGPKAVYIEDCWFHGNQLINSNQMIDSHFGSRIVMRYNKINDMQIQSHSGCSNGHRSTMHQEIYNNTFTSSDSGIKTWSALFIRGGTFVFHNNTITGTYASHPYSYIIDYQHGTDGCGNCASPLYPVGACTWPCFEQIGMGPDATASGKTSVPAYAWSNLQNGNPINITKGQCGVSDIVEGRDYYNITAKPGYTAYTYPHPLRTGEEDTTPPVMSNPLPSGVQQCDAASPVDITLAVSTNENANCKYDTSNTTYALMANTYGTGQGTTVHSQVISLACNASCVYYSRCQDTSPAQNTNTSSAIHNFSIAPAVGDVTPPVMVNPGPTAVQECSSNPRNVTLTVTATDETPTVTCKYHTSDVAYDSMAGTFGTKTGDVFTHAVSLGCGAQHTYYYLCADGVTPTPNKNTSSVSATFTILGPTPPGIIEAESGTEVAPISEISDPTASGGKYIATSTEYEGTATFTVPVAATGTYRIAARVYALDSGADSFFYKIDDLPEYAWALNPTLDPTYYNTWFIDYLNRYEGGWIDPYQVELTEGNHTFVFRGREADTRLDYFYLELASEPPNPPPGSMVGEFITGVGSSFKLGTGGTFILE